MKNDDEEFKIKNLSKFCKEILRLSCEHIGVDVSEAKEFINLKNVKEIVKSNSDNLILNEEKADKIVDEIQSWILGCQMAKMCSEGILNCYWDSKQDCMVFSVAEEGDIDGKKHNKS